MRLVAALILLLLGLGIGQAVAQPGRHSIVSCFEVTGAEVRTMYVDTGTTSYYPVGSEATVESSGGVTTLHAVVLLREPQKSYVPWVAR